MLLVQAVALTVLSSCAASPPRQPAVLAAEVRVKLQENFLDHVQVRSRGGRMELSGRVATPEQKQQASAIALSVPGVAAVYNDVHVELAKQE